MKLNVKASALAGAVVVGLGLFLLTWWLYFFGTATEEFAALVRQVYIGYSVDLAGSFVGLLWGAVDGFFGGCLFAWLYNVIVSRMPDQPEA